MYGLAIGVFDGLHEGHQILLNTMLNYCSNIELEPAVMLFYPSKKGLAFKKLNNTLFGIHNKGIHNVFVVGRDSYIYDMNAMDFISYINKMGVKLVVVGRDFVFGKDRRYNVSFLEENLCKFGMELVVIDVVNAKNEKLSTSLLKKLLLEYDFDKIKELSGEPFSLSGVIVKGRRFGTQKTGFKTANLELKNQLLPPNGVYITNASLDGNTYMALTYVGKSPVLKNEDKVVVETHILNKDFPDLYGKYLKIDFVSFLRKELSDVDKSDLIRQIKIDVSKAINSRRNNT